ncbi:MAG TPA: zinc ribbon domain-containing protein [Lentisphaeria bacterium]|nr:zinc ribbon domain-containing protein [Lentisphaeria bacterium]
MPIYEYSCPDCGNNFSHLHKRLGESVPECPKCHGKNSKKQFSTFAPATAGGSAPSCAQSGACPMNAGGSPHQCCASCHHR